MMAMGLSAHRDAVLSGKEILALLHPPQNILADVAARMDEFSSIDSTNASSILRGCTVRRCTLCRYPDEPMYTIAYIVGITEPVWNGDRCVTPPTLTLSSLFGAKDDAVTHLSYISNHGSEDHEWASGDEMEDGPRRVMDLLRGPEFGARLATACGDERIYRLLPGCVASMPSHAFSLLFTLRSLVPLM